MKHYICMLSIVGLIVISQNGLAGDIPANTAQLIPSCAPWDGAAMRLTFDLPAPGKRFEGTIWGKGLEALRAGESFTIDNVSGAEGTGSAQIVEEHRVVNDVPVITVVKAHFEPPPSGKFIGQDGDGKPGPWMISIPSPSNPDNIMIYPVSPVISMLQPLCG